MLSIRDQALEENVGTFGTTGSGKSYAARGLAERLLASTPAPRVCIIDPKGDWWGIRLAADGKHRGLDVTIIGGPHADPGLRLDADRPEPFAKPIATMIATSDVRCLIDLSDLDAGKMRRFVAELLKVLYHENRRPLHLICDEADEFAPQQTRNESAAVSLGAMERIAKRGRGRGIRLWPITQRPASLHTDIRGMCQHLLLLKLTLPHDRKAVGEWIKGQAGEEGKQQEQNVIESLPKLEQGEGWVWCTGKATTLVRTKFPRIHTFDSMKTPERGDSAHDKPLPPIDTAAVVSAMASAVQRDEENDPQKLREKIRALEAAMDGMADKARHPDNTTIDAAVEERIRQPDFIGGIIAEVKAEIAKQRDQWWTPHIKARDEAIRVLHEIIKRAAHEASGMFPIDDPRPDEADIPLDAYAAEWAAVRPKKPASPAKAIEHSSHTRAMLQGKAPMRMLGVLAAFEKMGVKDIDRRNLAVFSDQSPNSSAFRGHCQALIAAGDMRVVGNGTVAITEQGRHKAPKTTGPKTRAELHSMWASKLQPKQAHMMQRLIEARGPIPRDKLAEAADQSPKSSAFRANAQTLVSLGIAETAGAGLLKAGAVLFPEGLR